MAFPVVEDLVTQNAPFSFPDHLVDMPATVNSGDLLIVLISISVNNSFDSTPTGWTMEINDPVDADGSVGRAGIFWKTADGSEGGTTIGFETGTDTEGCAQVFRISGQNSVEFGAFANVDVGNTSPDPPALNPTFSQTDTLWIAQTTCGPNEPTISSAPSNYSNLITNAHGAGNVTIGSARRELNADSEDPGAFTLASSSRWLASTIGVEGTVEEDTTAPTYTTDGTLTFSDGDTSSVEISFDKAQDETTAQADIVYRLYRASQGTSIGTLSEIDSNGSEVASGTDVTSLIDTTITAGETYEYNVTAEDEATNRLAYDQLQVVANTLKGNVTLDGNPVEGAHVSVHTVDDFEMNNFTFIEILQTDASGEYVVTNYDDTNHYFFSVLYLNEDYSGTAESGSVDTLQDTDQAWALDEFDDGQSFIEITNGTGSGQIRRIISNTADTVTVEHDWDTNPDATSEYRIGVAYSDESRFVQSKD